MTLNEFLDKNLTIKSDEVAVSDDLIKKLKLLITDTRRYNHSFSVAKLCYEVALSNNLNNSLKFYLAGLIHDIGKNLDKEKSNDIIEAFYKEYENLPKYSYHQFTGEYLAIHNLGINDNDVLNAIKYHCTGRANMSLIEKVVYACDKIDPLRGFDSSELIKTMKDNAEKGFCVVLKANYEFLMSKVKTKEDENKIFNKLSAECFKYYLNIERN